MCIPSLHPANQLGIIIASWQIRKPEFRGITSPSFQNWYTREPGHLVGKPMHGPCSLRAPPPLCWDPSSLLCCPGRSSTLCSHNLRDLVPPQPRPSASFLCVYVPCSLLDYEGFQGRFGVDFISGSPTPVPTCRAHTTRQQLNKWVHSWFNSLVWRHDLYLY